MRVFDTDTKGCFTLFKALISGEYTTSQLKALKPVMDQIESNGKYSDTGHFGMDLDDRKIKIKMKQSEWELVKRLVAGSKGWKTGPEGNRVLKLIDGLNEVPDSKEETES